MIADAEEIGMSIEDRIIKAMEKDYKEKSPLKRFPPAFPAMTRHYIHLAIAIGSTNTIEQIIEFLKTCQHVESDIPISMLIEYLNKFEFTYHPIRHISQGRFKKVNK